jgi:arsenate reductase-like glutaredoxin family protein
MPSTKESWDQVGESWRDLGRHLRSEYQKLGEDQAREATEDRDKLSAAANQLSEHVGEALRSVRELVKDPQTKQSMERVIHEMGTAISVTFNAAADEVRERLPGTERAEPSKTPKAEPSKTEATKASSN